MQTSSCCLNQVTCKMRTRLRAVHGARSKISHLQQDVSYAVLITDIQRDKAH